MIISFGDYTIDVTPAFIIYPVMFSLILIGFAASIGFIWVCLSPGGDPLFSVPPARRSGSAEKSVEDATAVS